MKRVTRMRERRNTRKARTFDGKIFRQGFCYYAKYEADNEAEKQRRIGYNARVIEVGRKFCVYTRRK